MSRRPAMTQAVLTSLEALTTTVAATDETERGLRYLRRLIACENSPDMREKRRKVSEFVQSYKRQKDPTIGTVGRGGYRHGKRKKTA